MLFSIPKSFPALIAVVAFSFSSGTLVQAQSSIPSKQEVTPPVLNILGRGIQNKSDDALLLLACVGDRNGGTPSCDVLRLVYLESKRVPMFLSQAFKVESVEQSSAEMKQKYSETWVSAAFAALSVSNISAFTQQNGWNWANNPERIPAKRFHQVVSTLLYFAALKSATQGADAAEKTILVSKTIMDCSSKLTSMLPDYPQTEITEMCSANGNVGNDVDYQSCVANTVNASIVNGEFVMTGEWVISACRATPVRSRGYDLMGKIKNLRKDVSAVFLETLATAGQVFKVGQLNAEYEQCILNQVKDYPQVTDSKAFVLTCQSKISAELLNGVEVQKKQEAEQRKLAEQKKRDEAWEKAHPDLVEGILSETVKIDGVIYEVKTTSTGDVFLISDIYPIRSNLIATGANSQASVGFNRGALVVFYISKEYQITMARWSRPSEFSSRESHAVSSLNLWKYLLVYQTKGDFHFYAHRYGTYDFSFVSMKNPDNEIMLRHPPFKYYWDIELLMLKHDAHGNLHLYAKSFNGLTYRRSLFTEWEKVNE